MLSAKCKYKLRQYWATAKRDTFSPLFDKTQLLNLITIPVFLLLTFFAQEDFLEAMSGKAKAGIALLLSIPIWGAINLLLSPFRAYKDEKLLGKWISNSFVYHKPLHITTVVIDPNDNNKAIRFKVNEVAPNSFVYFEIEYFGGLSFIIISNHENNSIFLNGLSRNSTYGVKVNSRQEAVIHCRCPNDSDTTICRIYINRWAFEHSKPTTPQAAV